MRRWSWFLIPLLVLGLAELATRGWERQREGGDWYGGIGERQIEFLFVGTSRTATGIDVGVWASETGVARDRVVNLGRAYTGAVAHHLALRELLRRDPDALRGATVLIETVAGLPMFDERWEDRWFWPGNEQLVVDHLRASDLPGFLGAHAGFEERAGVLVAFAGRPVALVRDRRRLRRAIDWHGTRLLGRAVDQFAVEAEAVEAADALPAHRQLRTDAQGVRMMRDIVKANMDPAALAAQEPLPPFEEMVIADTVALLQEHGARVVFHQVPVPSYVWTANDTAMRRAERERFAGWARARGCPILAADLDFEDSDFPDLSHLRAGRVAEYTRALARAWAEPQD